MHNYVTALPLYFCCLIISVKLYFATASPQWMQNTYFGKTPNSQQQLEPLLQRQRLQQQLRQQQELIAASRNIYHEIPEQLTAGPYTNGGSKTAEYLHPSLYQLLVRQEELKRREAAQNPLVNPVTSNVVVLDATKPTSSTGSIPSVTRAIQNDAYNQDFSRLAFSDTSGMRSLAPSNDVPVEWPSTPNEFMLAPAMQQSINPSSVMPMAAYSSPMTMNAYDVGDMPTLDDYTQLSGASTVPNANMNSNYGGVPRPAGMGFDGGGSDMGAFRGNFGNYGQMNRRFGSYGQLGENALEPENSMYGGSGDAYGGMGGEMPSQTPFDSYGGSMMQQSQNGNCYPGMDCYNNPASAGNTGAMNGGMTYQQSQMSSDNGNSMYGEDNYGSSGYGIGGGFGGGSEYNPYTSNGNTGMSSGDYGSMNAQTGTNNMMSYGGVSGGGMATGASSGMNNGMLSSYPYSGSSSMNMGQSMMGQSTGGMYGSSSGSPSGMNMNMGGGSGFGRTRLGENSGENYGVSASGGGSMGGMGGMGMNGELSGPGMSGDMNGMGMGSEMNGMGINGGMSGMGGEGMMNGMGENGMAMGGNGMGMIGNGMGANGMNTLTGLGFNGAGVAGNGDGYYGGNEMGMGDGGGMGMGGMSMPGAGGMSGMEMSGMGMPTHPSVGNQIGDGHVDPINGEYDPNNMRRYAEYLDLINKKYGISMPGDSGMGTGMINGGNTMNSGMGTGMINGGNIMNSGLATGMLGSTSQMPSPQPPRGNQQQTVLPNYLTVVKPGYVQSSSTKTEFGTNLGGSNSMSNTGATSGGDTFVDTSYGTGQSPNFYKTVHPQPNNVENSGKQTGTGHVGSGMMGGIGNGFEEYGMSENQGQSGFMGPQSQPTTSLQALTQQIRRLPAVLYVDSRSPDARRTELMLREQYGLPLVSFYVDKIDKPKLVENSLEQLTAHKGLPYLFICGTFIGSQEHIDNYHMNKQIPQLVEFVCGEKKDDLRKRKRKKKKKPRPLYYVPRR
ncbi:CBR-PQN-26 protein [Ditylenchus destructor]|nr:CBR-PQN-26 protein [Ditylenchus destructor]